MSNSDPRLRVSAFCLGLLLLVPSAMTAAVSPATDLMPVPAQLQWGAGRLPVTAALQVAISGPVDDARLRGGIERFLRRAQERTGLTFPHLPAGSFAVGRNQAAATLVIECAAPGAALPVLGEDESYGLKITADGAVLRAPTTLGALHGLETLLQLLQSDSAGWFWPALNVNDQPRFPWRGLMIDVCRHWQPMDVIKRNLDGMALVKLNVLHIHLTEDQGFRIESLKFPRLTQLGSDGHYFTQAEMREIIAYAAARGIRVVPEFDIPGHATSWVTAYPELASAPGPYVIERKWGVFDPVLDPTNPKVYELLDGFLGEMAALFPDAYIHIGGDENNGVQWNANAQIQTYIREHMLKDNAGLHAYFNSRVHAILTKYGKKMIGWDEILHPDLPAGSVVHSWRGPDGIAEATKQGFATILSNGYYIDLNYPTVDHYLNDPVPADTKLTAEQQKLVLGGEATMWAEWVSPETIDSRIWPRTAAIAERLWSPRDVRDVPDMYRRLAIVSRRLEETGLNHERYLDPGLRRLAGDQATTADLAALRAFVDFVEPVKHYERGKQQPGYNQFSPLTGLVDYARADSAAGREFSAAVDRFLKNPQDAAARTALDSILTGWRNHADSLLARLPHLNPQVVESVPLLRAWSEAAAVGLEASAALAQNGSTASPAVVSRLVEPHAAMELPIRAALTRLLSVRPRG